MYRHNGNGHVVNAAKTMRSVIRSCGLLMLLTGSLAEGAEILNWYPACKYQVVDHVTVEREMVSRNGIVDIDEKELTTQLLINEIKNEAASAGAEAIILVNKKIIMPAYRKTAQVSDRAFHMRMEGELIDMCDEDKSLSKRPAPISDKGNEIMQLGGLSLSEKRITINLPGTDRKALTEGLSKDVSLESGVYGIKPGLTQEQVKSVYGFPVLVIRLSDDDELFGYGRELWLHFHKNTLHSVNSRAPSILSRYMLNLVPFDDYFDYLDWTYAGQPGKNQRSEKRHLEKSDKYVLEAYQEKVNSVDYKLTGFHYHNIGYDEPAPQMYKASGNYAWLASLLWGDAESHVNVQQNLQQIISNAIGQLYTDRVGITHIADSFMRIETVNEEIREVVIGDGFFSGKSDMVKWQVGEIKQDMMLKDTLPHLPAGALREGDVLRVTGEQVSAEFSFYEQRDSLKLYQIRFYDFKRL